MLDTVVPRLTTAADHGGLWLGVAALLAAGGNRGRRAAVRGLASLSVASAAANGPAKWTFRRQRPVLTDVPMLRQLARQPRTTSFPSGHAASAAAFAAGVALEAPAAALPVALVAATVAYGRVHIGVHYPSDVAAGVVLGVGAAVVVRRVWPARPAHAGVADAARSDAPALPDGDGLVVVVNAGAQSVAGAVDTVCETVRARLPRAEVVTCETPERVGEVLDAAARRATVLGVAGGDGTVSAAAGAAVEHGRPLVVLPVGTLNHFAGEVGVDDVDAACSALAAGQAVETSVASAGDRLSFLNTFSLGVYPELVQRRERRERVLGKWPALAVALAEVLGRAQPTHVEVDGAAQRVWLLFAGNGRYHPSGFAPSWRERLDEGVLDVRVVDAGAPWARTRLVVAVLTGRLGRCRVYREWTTETVQIRFRDDDPQLARDGEREPAPQQVTLSVPHRLVVYRPAS